MVTAGRSDFLLQGRVHLASKCRFLEVVSTLNEMEDVGHLRRAACFVLRSICVYVQGLWGETTHNCARFGMFF